MTASIHYDRQHILLDADDTLWENNIHFERSFEDFVAFLDHEHLSTAEIQTVLDEIEMLNRGTHGYGARSYARSLRDTYSRITGVPEADPSLEVVERLGLRILDLAPEIMDGVEATIAALRPHHDLYVVTKGHPEEQRAKIERSGFERFFDAVVISEEKNEHTYRSAVESLDLDPELTWMVGNSPRSDINPALKAGLNAIFIPHPRTWHLEVEEIEIPEESRTLLQLSSFRELSTIFVQEP